MIKGRSLMMSGVLKACRLAFLLLVASQVAEAQLHQPQGYAQPPRPQSATVYYPPRPQSQTVAPVSHQTYYSQATPQQVFDQTAEVPAMSPPVVPGAAPAYAMRNPGTPPVYMPLPGGHSLSEPTNSSTPAPGSMNADPLQLQDYGTLPEYQAPQSFQPPSVYGCEPQYCDSNAAWTWTVLPKDVLWQSYIGGPREPRLASSIVHLDGTGWLWELEAGGRAGILRYGSSPGQVPEGWQLDVWGGAFPRLNFEHELELDAVDFKVGVPLTWSSGPLQFKLEWYHISSHLGDEFLLRPENANYNRLDYLRDSIVFGAGYFPTPDWRIYGEADYAYNTNGGAEPWHFQFGVDYSPVCPTLLRRPSPFFGINGTAREEVNYSGGINIVAGIQWRGTETKRIFRTGLHYYAGQSLQLSFLGDYEEFLGWGLWLDF